MVMVGASSANECYISNMSIREKWNLPALVAQDCAVFSWKMHLSSYLVPFLVHCTGHEVHLLKESKIPLDGHSPLLFPVTNVLSS